MKDPSKSVFYILLIYFLGPFDFLKIGNFVGQVSGSNKRKHEPKFISFDSELGKIDIELDLSIPFLSVPLDEKDLKDKNGVPKSLVTVNPKGIVILGILLATSAFIVPLFIKPTPSLPPPPSAPYSHRYRMDQEWNVGNLVSDVLLRNGYVTPCVQRILCSVVTTIKHSENPTSTEKIIDGVFSHKWFEEYVNGSVIMDAVTIGQGSEKDCVTAYKECPVTQKIIDNMLRALTIL